MLTKSEAEEHFPQEHQDEQVSQLRLREQHWKKHFVSAQELFEKKRRQWNDSKKMHKQMRDNMNRAMSKKQLKIEKLQVEVKEVTAVQQNRDRKGENKRLVAVASFKYSTVQTGIRWLSTAAALSFIAYQVT